MTNSLPPLVIGLIALLPAALITWWGRRLTQLVDDPLLSERLLANRTRNGAVLGCCGAVLFMTAGSQLIWALPLLIVTRMTAGYRLRKALYGETWSLGGYFASSPG